MGASEKQLLREWIEVAQRRGWTVTVSRGHLKWCYPDGSIATFTGSTPNGGNRAIDNIRAKLRKAGLKEI